MVQMEMVDSTRIWRARQIHDFLVVRSDAFPFHAGCRTRLSLKRAFLYKILAQR